MNEKKTLADIISVLEQHCQDTVVKLKEYYHGYHELKEINYRLEEDLKIKKRETDTIKEQYNQLQIKYDTLLSEQEHIKNISLIADFMSSPAANYPHLEKNNE